MPIDTFMTFRKYLLIFAFNISVILQFSCISLDPVILHGDIIGSVTDAETSEPIQAALVRLNPSDDTILTGNEGTFLLKNISPGDYEIQASKFAYGSSSKNIKVDEAKTAEIKFEISGVPIPSISATYMDFGLDLTSMMFVISNIGKRKLSYVINSSKDWIAVSPFSGEILDETDTIRVTINRTALSDSLIYKEKIEITSTGGPSPLQDTIGVYLNGVFDARDLRYYKTVRIGTQTWMAENLNIGEQVITFYGGLNNGIIEKFCYHDEQINCEIYGGIYDWEESMQYNPSDSGTIGTTRGICPEGWHMPTKIEWQTLLDYLGGNQSAGGKLKETGTMHWSSPNTAATNETGFKALPGGFVEGTGAAGTEVLWSYEINSTGTFWTATIPPGGEQRFGIDFGSHLELNYSNSRGEIRRYPDRLLSCSVRCIKDP